MKESISDELDAAAAALEKGDAERCLELLEGLDASSDPEVAAETALIEAHAHLDLGDLAPAQTALERAARGIEATDPDLVAARAELALYSWDIDTALVELELLARTAPTPEGLERLSLCLELQDDFERADAITSRARSLAEKPVPPRFGADVFDEQIRAAIGDLTQPQQARLANARIVIEPVPFADLASAPLANDAPPDALGLFVGHHILDVPSEESGDLPPTIYLFQRNLERWCSTPDELRAQIRKTLYHELAHLLGYDEDGVDELGLT